MSGGLDPQRRHQHRLHVLNITRCSPKLCFGFRRDWKCAEADEFDELGQISGQSRLAQLTQKLRKFLWAGAFLPIPVPDAMENLRFDEAAKRLTGSLSFQ
jgi:hypothetical protein